MQKVISNALPSIMQCLEGMLAQELAKTPHDQNDDMLEVLRDEMEKKLPKFMKKLAAAKHDFV